MATLAITDNLNLCKNNYYYALTSESAQNPPPNILPSHTGIANSGATDFYFAPDAPGTNYNPQALTVGVCVANGRPERSARTLGGQCHTVIGPISPASSNDGTCHACLPSYPHRLGAFC
jgi:hypothetical protein